MVAFNPDIPETQEPNYLRYSRPSNYAPVNKGAGEAIKGVAQVVGQAGRAADSVVTSGIKSEVDRQAQDFSQQHVAGLEQRYNELLNPNPTDPNTPREINNLPGKIDALNSAKAKGTYVQSQYDSQLYGLAKDMRSKFPGYRDIIDREVSRASGAGMANPYAHALQAGINAIEGKIDNEQKRKENIVDTYTKEGNISPVMRAAYDQGKLSADYLIHEGTTRTFQARNLEMATKRNAYEESGYKLDAVKAAHGADNARDIFLAQTVKDASVVQGTETTPKFLQFKADLDSGRKQYMTPEEQQQFQQSLDLGRQRYISRWDEYVRTSGLAESMGSEEYTRKRKEAEDVYNTYQGMSNPKDYVQQHSYAKWMETKTEGDKMAMELSPTGELLRRQGIAQGMAKGNLFIERKLSDMLATDPNMDKGLHGFLYDKLLHATTGPSVDGSPNPNVHATVNDLNRLGFKGNATNMVVNWADMIKDSNVPDEAKRNLVDFTFAGDGAKLLPQLAKESPLPVQGKDYTVSAEERPITKGRYYLADKWFSQDTVDAVYKLGGNSWQTYKDAVTSSTRTMLGSEIPDLNKYAEQGYQFKWDSKNNTLGIEDGVGSTNQDTGEVTPAKVTPGMRREVDNVNKVLQGIKNVASKEPNIDVNAYLLKALQEGGLGNNEAAQAIQRAIISSHKSSQLENGVQVAGDVVPGPWKPNPNNPPSQGGVRPPPYLPMPTLVPKEGAKTMSDAGDQMGMGATAMNMLPRDLEPAGETMPAIRPSVPGPKSVKSLETVPGTFDSSAMGKSVKSPKVNPTPEMQSEMVRQGLVNPEPSATAKLSTKDIKAIAKQRDIADRDIQAFKQENRLIAEPSHIQQTNAQYLIDQYKGLPREAEVLNQKMEQLKIRAANYGEGVMGKDARNQMKLIRSRLREMNVESQGNRLEKDIKDTVSKEFK